MSSTTPDRSVVVPSLYTGQADANLLIHTADGETATMSLVAAGRLLAVGEDFRRPNVGPHTWLDCPDAEVLSTFGAFLGHALESSEDDARDGWPVLFDEAGEWVDALYLAGEEA